MINKLDSIKAHLAAATKAKKFKKNNKTKTSKEATSNEKSVAGKTVLYKDQLSLLFYPCHQGLEFFHPLYCYIIIDKKIRVILI